MMPADAAPVQTTAHDDAEAVAGDTERDGAAICGSAAGRRPVSTTKRRVRRELT